LDPDLSRLFKALIHKKNPENNASENNLSDALELSSENMRDNREILKGIIHFREKTVSQIMTSRIDIFALDIRSGFPEIIEGVIHSGYSRIPIFAETVDTIKGILYAKDLLTYFNDTENFRWKNVLRPAYFVPETKKIADLMSEFRTGKIHLATVVDEFGGTSGIVTMEDILEEIVGEISDEYDQREDFKYKKLADGSYIFEGKTLLTDFFKITAINPKIFRKLTDDVETLAGLVLEIKGTFPEKREIVEFDGYTFQALEISQRRISKIKFLIKQDKLAGENIS
jgi:CBS domain containing-hemolysin-like protein